MARTGSVRDFELGDTLTLQVEVPKGAQRLKERLSDLLTMALSMAAAEIHEDLDISRREHGDDLAVVIVRMGFTSRTFVP